MYLDPLVIKNKSISDSDNYLYHQNSAESVLMEKKCLNTRFSDFSRLTCHVRDIARS